MSKSLFLTFLVAAITWTSCGTSPEANAEPTEATESEVKGQLALTDGEYNVVSEESTCTWLGTELSTKTHTGSINVYKGNLTITDNTLASGFVGIDMNSINCTDLEGDAKGNLEGHLKSDDFFGVENYPFASINVEGVKTKDGASVVYGKLTIRDVTEPIAFPAVITQNGNDVSIDADMSFDRSKFGVKFRSGAFPDLFPDLGDKLINDEINLNVHLVARM